MSETNANMTLIDFLRSDEAFEILEFIACSVEDASDVVERAEWLDRIIDEADRDFDIFESIEQTVSHLQGAVVDLERLAAIAHERLGHIAKAKAAIDRFVSKPTEHNRQALADASRVMSCSRVSMEGTYRRKLRPFLKNSKSRPKLSFGNLNGIASSHLDQKMIISPEVAA